MRVNGENTIIDHYYTINSTIHSHRLFSPKFTKRMELYFVAVSVIMFGSSFHDHDTCITCN